MGSITAAKPDRLLLNQSVTNHRWSVPYKWKTFTKLVTEVDNKDEYREVLLNSSFTLCPVGTADDNFRFWEAIEAGSIPILVPRNKSLLLEQSVLDLRGNRDCPDSFQDVLRTNPPIVQLKSWDELPEFIESMTEHKIEVLRRRLFIWNYAFWVNTTRTLDEAIRKHSKHRHHNRNEINLS